MLPNEAYILLTHKPLVICHLLSIYSTYRILKQKPSLTVLVLSQILCAHQTCHLSIKYCIGAQAHFLTYKHQVQRQNYCQIFTSQVNLCSSNSMGHNDYTFRNGVDASNSYLGLPKLLKNYSEICTFIIDVTTLMKMIGIPLMDCL